MTTQIHHDQAIALGELRDEGVPVLPTSAEAMQEDQGPAGAVFLVVQLDVTELNDAPAIGCCHGARSAETNEVREKGAQPEVLPESLAAHDPDPDTATTPLRTPPRVSPFVM